MAKKPIFADDAPFDGPVGLYDVTPADQPWFLAADETLLQDDLPLPRAARRVLMDPRDWARAQAELAGELASVALLFGALDQRLRMAPVGWRHRLALLEAAELSWWVGDRIGIDRLALWDAQRLAGVQDDSQALARLGWALRRLAGSPDLQTSVSGVAAFLGRHGPVDAASGDVEDLTDLLLGAADLHPITRSAVAFHGWRMLGEGGPVTEIEAAVLAARLAAAMGRGSVTGTAAAFMPIALSGFAAGTGGPVYDRLALWLRGAERATLAALLHLERLTDWNATAEATLADLQGRTPLRLIKVLTEWPTVTAPMAETMTQASRASVQRNLTLMQSRGLIREVTGQGRYRVWTAKI